MLSIVDIHCRNIMNIFYIVQCTYVDIYKSV